MHRRACRKYPRAPVSRAAPRRRARGSHCARGAGEGADRLRSSRPTYSPASKLPTTERSKLLTTEDTGDTEEQTFPEGFYLRVLRVPRGGEFFQRGGEFPERSGEFHERWTPGDNARDPCWRRAARDGPRAPAPARPPGRAPSRRFDIPSRAARSEGPARGAAGTAAASRANARVRAPLGTRARAA